MSLNSLVSKSVDMAFQKAGDLTTIVIFYKKDSSEYDFNTQETVVDDVATVVIRGIQMKKKRENPAVATNTIAMEMLFKTKDVGEVSAYSSAVINGVTWNIAPLADMNNYTTVVTFMREK